MRAEQVQSCPLVAGRRVPTWMARPAAGQGLFGIGVPGRDLVDANPCECARHLRAGLAGHDDVRLPSGTGAVTGPGTESESDPDPESASDPDPDPDPEYLGPDPDSDDCPDSDGPGPDPDPEHTDSIAAAEPSLGPATWLGHTGHPRAACGRATVEVPAHRSHGPGGYQRLLNTR